jgi:hypothetical protein
MADSRTWQFEYEYEYGCGCGDCADGERYILIKHVPCKQTIEGFSGETLTELLILINKHKCPKVKKKDVRHTKN